MRVPDVQVVQLELFVLQCCCLYQAALLLCPAAGLMLWSLFQLSTPLGIFSSGL
jgi:hypothetical protein